MIYISGPISGTTDYLDRFKEAENDFYYNHVDIINPAEVLNTLPTYRLEYKDLMRLCLDLLSMCDTIYMLIGWENSRGARLEYEFAKTHNYRILFQK